MIEKYVFVNNNLKHLWSRIFKRTGLLYNLFALDIKIKGEK